MNKTRCQCNCPYENKNELTAFLKNKTENEMTTTRFTQLPTLCVTGETRAKIMYEICWYMWKQAPAMIAF